MKWLSVSCLLILLLTISITNGKPVENSAGKCGYDACQGIKSDMINVHLVPHTHDDVGWLKTIDQYYYGSRTKTQKAGVQYILDSVIQELLKDPNKKFIYVETAFLWKWWQKQHDTLRHQVKKLINRGQLEIIGGGWAMNDEAVTHYQSIIDQFTWGLRKLNETFGECGRPKIGWQIDPFGHSREMGSIFAQMGFDAMFLGRLDFQDKRQRLKTQTTEMLWKTSANFALNISQLFTSVLFNNYAPPPGFCFDILCQDDPIIDDKNSPDYNVDRRISDLINYVRKQSESYRTNNVLLTMGEDFNYQDAHMWYVNIDKLIRYTNALQSNGSNINVLYSTPSCYVKAVHDEDINRKWPIKSDDFFPYASDPTAYWTGYFTSRPTIKRFERLGNNFLQVCKQLYALTDLGPEDWVDLNALREAMGVMQHHDAVTGTEQQHVAFDYARILSDGFKECGIITNIALNKLMSTKEQNPKLSIDSCLLLNISQCFVTEQSDNFVVTLYNPISRPVSQYVRIPVTGKAYTVTDPNGMDLMVQLTPIPKSVLTIPGRTSSAVSELIFHASDLPPLGFKSYFVQKSNVMDDLTVTEDLSDNKHILKDGNIIVELNDKTGLLSKIRLNNLDLSVQQDFLWYEGSVGNNREYKNRSSGAYIFRPNGTNPNPVSSDVKTTVYKGPLSQEIHQVFNDWVSQVIRIYNQENYVELEWMVGPIPINDGKGKEIISQFKTPLSTNQTFYTDSNGREILKRARNYRPTWNVHLDEPVAGNYYPVTSRISIRDEAQNIELSVLTDRAQGGSSLRDGELELMVHRRLLHDDAFGVGEALSEQAFGKGLVARGQHYLIADYFRNVQTGTAAALERDLAQRKLLQSWTFVTPINSSVSYQQYKNQYTMQYSGLKSALPKNVQILTLEPWKASSFLLRLEHIFELNEDPELSKPVTVDLKNLFIPFSIISARETTLGANQWIEDNQRLNWQSGKNLEQFVDHSDYNVLSKDQLMQMDQANDTNEVAVDDLINDFQFTLQPMQIRTFVIEIEKS